MASEVLAVPEEKLAEVIAVIRAGLRTTTVSAETHDQLTNWCDAEERYLKDMASTGDDDE